MEVNKVVYNGEALIDLTEDTVTEETLAKGVTAHTAAGLAVTGVMTGGGNVLYGTCSTTVSTAAKAVVCPEADELFAGLAVLVSFSNYSTVNAPTLNVNSLGAKSIYNNGAAASSSNYFRWAAGTAVLFIYDGTYWLPVGMPDSYYGECSTAAATAAKTATVAGFVLRPGVSVTLKMANANSNVSPTLNIGNTGAFSITGNVDWSAGDYITFTFDGSKYAVSADDLADIRESITELGEFVDQAKEAAEKAQSTADEALSTVNSLQNNRYLWSGYLQSQGSSSQQAYVYTEPGFELKDGAMLLLHVMNRWNGYYSTGKLFINGGSSSYNLWSAYNADGTGYRFNGFSAGDVVLIVYDEENTFFEVRQVIQSIAS